MSERRGGLDALADGLRWAIVALAWAGFVIGALGVTVKAVLVLAPSLAARTLVGGRADVLLTGALLGDLVATVAGAYDHLAWWDVLAHTALPALLLPVVAAGLARWGALGRRGTGPRAAWAVVVVVGLLWEVVELGADAGLGTHFNLGLRDSALDVVCDVVGATLAAGLLPVLVGTPRRREMPALRSVGGRS